MSENYFSFLGLSVHYPVDKVALSERYHMLQQAVHPDRFSGQPQGMQMVAQQYAANINLAYKILQDPLQGALYWLTLQAGVETLPLSGEFLMEQMEWREAMECAPTMEEKQAIARKVQVEAMQAQTAFTEKVAAGLPIADLQALAQRWKFMDQMAQSFLAEINKS